MPVVRTKAWAVAAGGALLLAGCTGGSSGARGAAGPRPTTTATGPATTVTTTSAPPSTTLAAGAVTLRATAFTLPDAGPGGSGLRVLVRPTTPQLRVRRTGGGGLVTACPLSSVAGPAGPGGCTDVAAGAAVDVAAWGVDLRATGAATQVDEVDVTYVPSDPSVTLVTPARPAGACAATPCQAAFTLDPPRAGAFRLDGRSGGGMPVLTLFSNSGPGGSNRTLATVAGGGNLSISATLDGTSETTLAYTEGGADAIPALTAEILWP